ncbi:hypothetical protein [Deefgea rivuli]|uniref:hypothetical protein n=1 Tax=Deefgea rivuli TaxID=400948 RepID=UPI0004823158|nr:hypothetical protein [Deefgea rivuli]
MLQPHVIQVGTWRADEQWGLAYPEGARAKKRVLSQDEPCFVGIKPNWYYLFKHSDRRYPQQFWGEILAYQIGLMLEISVPPAFVAYDESTQQYAALIEWFYQEGITEFYPAGHIFQRENETFDRRKGGQHNWSDACRISRETVGKIWRKGIADMVLLDTLIGNSDRHQDNWGFLIDVADLQLGQYHFRFAPWFDNGTSFGSDRWPDRVLNWPSDRMRVYVDKGCHHMRDNPKNLVRVPHMVLFEVLVTRNEIKDYFVAKLANFDFDRFVEIMNALGTFELPDKDRLDPLRIEWIKKLLSYRLERMREILK